MFSTMHQLNSESSVQDNFYIDFTPMLLEDNFFISFLWKSDSKSKRIKVFKPLTQRQMSLILSKMKNIISREMISKRIE